MERLCTNLQEYKFNSIRGREILQRQIDGTVGVAVWDLNVYPDGAFYIQVDPRITSTSDKESIISFLKDEKRTQIQIGITVTIPGSRFIAYKIFMRSLFPTDYHFLQSLRIQIPWKAAGFYDMFEFSDTSKEGDEIQIISVLELPKNFRVSVSLH